MKIKTSLLSLIISLVSLCPAHAKPFDLYPKVLIQGSRYVRVTYIEASQQTSFEDCQFGREESTCKPIGPKQFYSIEDLKNQRLLEDLKFVGSLLPEAAAIAVGFATGTWIGAVIGIVVEPEAASITMWLSLSTATGGAIAGPVVLSKAVDALIPGQYIKNVWAIRDSVIYDKKNVTVSDMTVSIQRLEALLNKL